MRNWFAILSVGLIAGALDLIPLVLVKAPLFNMLSIMVFWLSASIFVSRTTLLKNTIFNGLVISLILMLPIALAVSATNPGDFVPMMAMAIILGPLAGFSLSKVIKNTGGM